MQIVEFKSKSKLIISKEVLAQVSYLHHKVGNIEWSGLIFYKIVSGDITEPSSLVLRCERLYLMDIGSAAYTEFSPDSSIIDFYTKYPEAADMKWGMLHTHHDMKAFFSGTDNDELISNADAHNFYLSLIVNFLDGGNFCAKIGIMAEIETKYSFKNGLDFKGLNDPKKPTTKQLLTINCEIEYDVDSFDADRYTAIKTKKLEKSFKHSQQELSPVYSFNKDKQTSFNFGEDYKDVKYIPKTPKEIEEYLAKAISLDYHCKDPLKIVLDNLQIEATKYGEQFDDIYGDSFDYNLDGAYYTAFQTPLLTEHHNQFFRQCILFLDKYRMSGYTFYDLLINVLEMYVDIQEVPKNNKKTHIFSGINNSLDKQIEKWNNKQKKSKK